MCSMPTFSFQWGPCIGPIKNYCLFRKLMRPLLQEQEMLLREQQLDPLLALKSGLFPDSCLQTSDLKLLWKKTLVMVLLKKAVKVKGK